MGGMLSEYLWSWHKPRMSRSAFTLWTAMVYKFSGNNGFGSVSHQELMKLTGIGSRETVRLAFRELERSGRIERPLLDHERGLATYYSLKRESEVGRQIRPPAL